MNAKERREMNEPSGSGASERKGGRTAWFNTCHSIGWFCCSLLSRRRRYPPTTPANHARNRDETRRHMKMTVFPLEVNPYNSQLPSTMHASEETVGSWIHRLWPIVNIT